MRRPGRFRALALPGRAPVALVALIALFALLALAVASCAPTGRKAKLPSEIESSRPAPLAVTPAPAPAPAAETTPVPPLPEPPLAAVAPRAVSAPKPFTGWVRIGLATDLESVTLPCCDGELAVEVGGARLDVESPLRIRPAATSVGGAVYRVQIAALRDEDQAKELARRLGTLASEPADSRFDAQAGVFRVRLGRFATRIAAEEASRRLTRFGVDSSWIVSEGSGVGEPALEVMHRAVPYRVVGRRFALEAPADGGVRWEGKRYRGRLVVFLNDRGRLNVVNELPIEQYLRGVVPRELGPGAYPELEALKAQAVAARSYTLRNLGEFADEGYDLCGTPRCQVYGGMDDEHPLSDRAVAETASEVLFYDGQPIDALYSATCGGHTENVEVIFPLKRAPYLRGVPCIEGGDVRLAGSDAAGVSLRRRLLDRILPGSAAALVAGSGLLNETGGVARVTAAGLEGALVRLASAAGLATPVDHLANAERREVQRYLGSLFDLAADARLFVHNAELDYLVAHPPPEWNEEDRRLAAYFVESGLLAAPAASSARSAIDADEAEDLLLHLALFLQVLEQREASFSSVTGQELVAREGGAELHYRVSRDLATFRVESGITRGGDLVLAAGDDLHLYLAAGELVAVAQEVDPRGAAFDRTHNLSRWNRFRSDEELRTAAAARLPGFVFRSFEVLSRGVSGRVGKIRLVGTDNETIDVEGLAVRWTLDLPDTLFTARRLTPPQGKAGWQFTGRGWGHGVGLCQVGSYGMARRGHDYRGILAHYYSGAELRKIPYSLAPVAPASAPSRQPAPIAAPRGAR
ncbi:MAG: SpoIID/LytB domain-containing protein [Thermoanaerobaculia bacterium]